MRDVYEVSCGAVYRRWKKPLPSQWIEAGAGKRYRITDNPATVERWMKAIGKLPD